MRNLKGMTARALTWMVVALLAVVGFGVMGCTRPDYRMRADRDVYAIERERTTDRRWASPFRFVEADPSSRMRDPGDPDFNPIPPDDPEARKWQVSGAYPFEFHGWKERGSNPIEDLSWMAKLPKEADGSVLLTQNSVMQLAVTHSREYQTQVENVYETALALTLSRFVYAVQWFGGQQTFFQHLGGIKNDSNQLQLNTADGFNKTFASGAQLLVDYTNALVFEFHGHGFNTSTSGLLVNVTQPLLRGAFARIQTQALSQQERLTLYTIRDFARYRRGFYVNITASNGFLGILTQLQAIRNLENNLESQRRNLVFYNEQVIAGLIPTFQRDQFAQGVQQSEISLISSRASLQTTLDSYKIQLGLPPDLLVKLDDSVLKNFELNDPRLDALRIRNDNIVLSLLQEEVTPREKLEAAMDQVLEELTELDSVLGNASEEISRWRSRLANPVGDVLIDPATILRQTTLSSQLKRILTESRSELIKNQATARELRSLIPTLPPDEATRRTLELTDRDFRARFTEVFSSQTQARVFLIELPPVTLTLEDSVSIALANRLDLMNSQARVTDAWRNVEVAANNLKGGLNITYTGNLGTDPKHDGIFRFDASNSTQRIGLQFDAPVNRRAERNVYRADQISYQQARRAYMATHDLVLQQIRLDLRQLDANRRNFEIARESFITLTQQVEQAEYEVRTNRIAASDVTVLLSNALNSLLSAKNTLISTWVSYETSRMSLFRDFDLMDIDARGAWTNERDDTSRYQRCVPAGGFGAAVDNLGGESTAAPIGPVPETEPLP